MIKQLINLWLSSNVTNFATSFHVCSHKLRACSHAYTPDVFEGLLTDSVVAGACKGLLQLYRLPHNHRAARQLSNSAASSLRMRIQDHACTYAFKVYSTLYVEVTRVKNRPKNVYIHLKPQKGSVKAKQECQLGDTECTLHSSALLFTLY